MFELVDQPTRLCYVAENTLYVVDAGAYRPEEHWYDEWLESMVKSTPDVIFFLVVKTTDVFVE